MIGAIQKSFKPDPHWLWLRCGRSCHMFRRSTQLVLLIYFPWKHQWEQKACLKCWGAYSLSEHVPSSHLDTHRYAKVSIRTFVSRKARRGRTELLDQSHCAREAIRFNRCIMYMHPAQEKAKAEWGYRGSPLHKIVLIEGQRKRSFRATGPVVTSSHDANDKYMYSPVPKISIQVDRFLS